MADERVGPVGWILAANIKRIRESQRLTYAELSRLLAAAGREIPILGLRRIESTERRVDVDDLLALAYVLKAAPVDLLVSGDATDEPYPVTPEIESTADAVREWVRGEEVLTAVQHPGSPFAMPVDMLDAVKWMPKDRARRVTERYFEDEES
jgi:hypothetical protein